MQIDDKVETELLEICRNNQGERIPLHHGPGSWATTYSVAFVDAATKLYAMYRDAGVPCPDVRMSVRFAEAGIRSCRGSAMTIDRVEYLYRAHIAQRLAS